MMEVPQTGVEAPPLGGVVWGSHPGVPFANLVRRVSRLFEFLSDGGHVSWYALESGNGVQIVVPADVAVVDIDVDRMAAREQRGTRWRAGAVRVVLIEFDAFFLCQTIERGGLYLFGWRIAMVTNVGPAPVVDKKHEDVRLVGCVDSRT